MGKKALQKNGAIFRDIDLKLSDPQCFCMQLPPWGQRNTQDGEERQTRGRAAEKKVGKEADHEGEEDGREGEGCRKTKTGVH